MKNKCSQHIFEMFLHFKFHENPSSGNRIIPCQGADGRTERKADFHSTANVPKIIFYYFGKDNEIYNLCTD
jgi:hypothetical protein